MNAYDYKPSQANSSISIVHLSCIGIACSTTIGYYYVYTIYMWKFCSDCYAKMQTLQHAIIGCLRLPINLYSTLQLSSSSELFIFMFAFK